MDNEHIEKTIKKNLLNEMLSSQLSGISPSKRLHYKDLARIVSNINTSIFSGDKCCVWDGYVTNIQNAKKGTYINFYFKGRKVALHRLIYANFVGNIRDSEYLKFSCDNKGKCCNINHLIKYEKNTDNDSSDFDIQNSTTKSNKKKAKKMLSDTNDNDFKISFD